MATQLAVYSEHKKRFYHVAAKIPLSLDDKRRLMGSPLRYCVGGDYLYAPADDAPEDGLGQLCWARIHSSMLPQLDPTSGGNYLGDFFENCDLNKIEELGISIGDRYLKRLREVDGALVPVEEFVSQALFDSLTANPEALPSVSRSDFEALCAEIFARRGFQVDLFRGTGDGGIDFLAVQEDLRDPIVFAVQCKQPDIKPDGRRKSVGRPVLQQIYGAAKAWDLRGGILISGSTYTPQAKKFSELKPSEMKVHNGKDVLEWISSFRWNKDEAA